MTTEGGHIDRCPDVTFDRSLVFAPLAPVPEHRGVHRFFGNIFEIVEDVDYVLAQILLRMERRKREAAVAIHRGRNPIGGHRLHHGRPPHGPIPVVMNFYGAWRHVTVSRVDDPLTSVSLK